ncbi:hypothetical protein [Gemmobacter sp. 24YEA27]|uniref:hypothetical protein n=1 Tax=Gemmobacter sp. 24YEA27 TaxID=3040672 RepID=UPI0024B371BF|nr:hypothetical protein [Gemmobacter sp. 24YEA27]
MGALILRWLWKPVAVLLALLAVWLRGRASAKQQTALEAAEAYVRGRKGMDKADAEISDAPHVLRSALSVRPPDTK